MTTKKGVEREWEQRMTKLTRKGVCKVGESG